jgi:hypothetical protein
MLAYHPPSLMKIGSPSGDKVASLSSPSKHAVGSWHSNSGALPTVSGRSERMVNVSRDDGITKSPLHRSMQSDRIAGSRVRFPSEYISLGARCGPVSRQVVGRRPLQ